ncbi:MAG: winged helix-turn-helix transcriptional regulator [Dehalococcoidia bacterium]|nr:winged helix-turn-helix transcriptional regulator [Dehalococcoidia bacterium]
MNRDNGGIIGDGDYRSLAEFRVQIRRYLHFSEDLARRSGVEPAQYQLMLAVKGMPEGRVPTISYLCEALQIRHHSAVELVNRTEARGFVARFREAADRRLVLVRLTDSGEQLLAALASHHLMELRTAGPTLVHALESILERHRV